MFFTLDRIENETIAVLIDDNRNKYDISIELLGNESVIGNVYESDGTDYIYNEKETQKRKNSNSEKLKKLMSKAKNRK